MDQLQFEGTEDQIQELRRKVGVEQAEKVLQRVTDNVFGPKTAIQQNMEAFQVKK